MNKDIYLSKIISGRTRINLDGLFLYIVEPKHKLIAKSYEIYEDVYNECFMNGVYTSDEIKNVLAENNIWTPADERSFEELKKELENKKVECFESYYNGRLRQKKFELKLINDKIQADLVKKTSMDHLSCEFMAEEQRYSWLIFHSTYLNGRRINQDFDITKIMYLYNQKSLPHTIIKSVARYDSWRSIWTNVKIQKGRLFNRDIIDYSRDQLYLCSYSNMYDNVYENPECPDEEIINDDDCLDGWMILQRRKFEKSKKEKQVEDIIKNPKIKGAKEVFLVSNNKADAEKIQSLNDDRTRNIIQQREEKILSNGRVKDTDFNDVQLELSMNAAKDLSSRIRGK